MITRFLCLIKKIRSNDIVAKRASKFPSSKDSYELLPSSRLNNFKSLFIYISI